MGHLCHGYVKLPEGNTNRPSKSLKTYWITKTTSWAALAKLTYQLRSGHQRRISENGQCFFFCGQLTGHLITGGSHHCAYWNAVDMWMVAKSCTSWHMDKIPFIVSAIIVSASHNFLTKWYRISSIHNALYVAYTKHPSILC